MKRWLSYGAACIAAAAVLYGTLTSAHHPSANNTAWVAALTKQAGVNNTVGIHADSASSQVETLPNSDATSGSQRSAVTQPNSAAIGKANARGTTSTDKLAASDAGNVGSRTAKLTASTTATAHGPNSDSAKPSGEGGTAARPANAGSTVSAGSRSTGRKGSTTTANHGTAGTSAKNSSSRNSATSGGTSQSSGNALQSSNDGSASNHSGGSASSTPPQNTGEFTILVTEDNGKTQVAEKHVSIQPGVSLMQYMGQLFHIETAYGGAFIVSIEGIRSQWTGVPAAQRQPVDWFLYVNGKEAPVGAGSIYPKPGDIDIWDYHRWDPSTGKG